MPSNELKFRTVFLTLFCITFFGCCFASHAAADTFGPARPAIFASGSYGFKMLPNGQKGILFLLQEDGSEKVIWDKQLVNIPMRAFVKSDGKSVVTIDTYAYVGFEHSIVVYDAQGKVLGDYKLEDFLTEEQIRDKVIQTSPNRWWADEAKFNFRHEERNLEFFDITLNWGKVITVDLNTGKLVKSPDDPVDQPVPVK